MSIYLRKILSVCGVILFFFTNAGFTLSEKTNNSAEKTLLGVKKSPVKNVFDSLHLAEKGLSKYAYECALDGFDDLRKEGLLKNDSIVTIVDFDQPSYNKRMYVIDIKHYKVLFNTWTAHGKNTGGVLAQSFSNRRSSNKSSLGLYITDEPYYGSKGYSLKLIGLDDTNFNAEERSIVLHGAWYVSQAAIDAKGYIGRSHGCPAVPQELTKPIIEKIKGGSCFFIYNKSYHRTA